MRKVIPTLVTTSLLVFMSQFALAGSATWNLNPASGDWNTAANWTPAMVPNGPSDIATFGSSNLTDIFTSTNTTVNSIVFPAGASAFTISPELGTSFEIDGVGVVNDSGATQTFVIGANFGIQLAYLYFEGAATAGNSMTTYITEATAVGSGASTFFVDTANAGSATFLTEGGLSDNQGASGGSVVFSGTPNGPSASAATATFINGGGKVSKGGGGVVAFFASATAADATIINNPGEAPMAQGGVALFDQSSTADHAVITNNGSTVDGGLGGLTFFRASHAAHGTFIANSGTGGGAGGLIIFLNNSFGDFARIQLFGNGTLQLRYRDTSTLTIGSLEGDGLVSMGTGSFAIGSNNLNTEFAGTIFDSPTGGGGALIKIGRGTLSLKRASTYTGSTIIREGTLAVRNQQGSATGTGLVSVKAGTLAGGGTLGGNVIVGTQSAGPAILSPGTNAANPQTLTIQGSLTLEASSTYSCDLKSDSTQADNVVAAGVSIVGDSQISLADSGTASLPPGTSFTIIRNTAATPISGTFSNLPDGEPITVGSNTFQANYEGGDGNDLTLTVVP